MKVKVTPLATVCTFFIICAILSGCQRQTGSTEQTTSTGQAGTPGQPGAIGAKKKLDDPGDSPINIGGGSIYGVAKNGWTSTHSQPDQFRATSNNIEQIILSGVGNFDNPLPSPLSLNGWVIILSNRLPDSDTRNPNAVTITSDANCLTGTGCNNNPSIGDHQTVYVSIRGDSRGALSSDNIEFRFHDKNNRCDGSGPREHPQCDFLYDVTLISPSITNHIATGTCARGGYARGHCEIGIGTK